MKLLAMIIISSSCILITGCASEKTGTPTPAYATYYFPVYYPAYNYAPYFDEHYEPDPSNNNFNYYGYYGYWGKK